MSEREIAALAEMVAAPVTPQASLRNRLRRRVAEWEAPKPLAEVRPSGDEGWVGLGVAGIEMRSLFRDDKAGTTTMLLRMAPGTGLPAHIHHGNEQCYVLQGDVGWGEVVYREGDFVVMGEKTRHPEIRSVGGTLLLVVAGHNEFAEA